ncbi:hypothetical protein Ancab_035518 [Ancistrocladus abbreviatus]
MSALGGMADVVYFKTIMGNHEWDEAKLERCFNSNEARLIQSISLSSQPMEDELIWHHHEKGIFSVKLAYYALFWTSWNSSTNTHHFLILCNDIWLSKVWRMHSPPSSLPLEVGL